jgi:hypothetical protein
VDASCSNSRFNFSNSQVTYDRHSERSEAIYCAANRRVDCFVAALLAMTTTHASAFPRRKCARVMHEIFRLSITEGAGKAGCPMHPQPRVQ